jgi:hypothetical protein
MVSLARWLFGGVLFDVRLRDSVLTASSENRWTARSGPADPRAWTDFNALTSARAWTFLVYSANGHGDMAQPMTYQPNKLLAAGVIGSGGLDIGNSSLGMPQENVLLCRADVSGSALPVTSAVSRVQLYHCAVWPMHIIGRHFISTRSPAARSC